MASLISRLSTKSEGRTSATAIAGLILVPLIVAGLFVYGLWNPMDRLGTVNAAIVNNDEPVTINGQLTPLGRLLSAGLVDGVEGASNYRWVVTNEAGANKGLADGSYVAAVTIPKDFSKNATSSMVDTAHPVQALIDVKTTDKSKLVDDAITTVIASAAVNAMNQQLTSSYLENLFIGFSSLSSNLGTAATGAHSLATGMDTLATGTKKLSTGTTAFANGLSDYAAGISSLPAQTKQMTDGLAALVGNNMGGCLGSGASVDFCTKLATLSGGLSYVAAGLPAVSGGATTLAASGQDIATGLKGISTGVSASATGATDLANGLDKAVAGIPTYGKEETKKLASVATNAVGIANGGSLSFGQSSTPLYIVLALWLGALATFIGLRALPRRLLETTRSSLSLAVRSFTIPGIIAVTQGVLVATIIAFAQGFTLVQWASVAGLSALVGLAFTATNQALTALFGGFGRLISLVVGLLILVTGVVATVPGVLVAALAVTPASEAITALQAAINPANVSGLGGAITAVVLWLIGAVLMTSLAISRKRHVSITALSRQTQLG
jgi:putative membrane protein